VSHKQIAYSLVLALLCSINIQMNASATEKSLQQLVQEWNKLTEQQSLASCTKNLQKPCAQVACRSCTMCFGIALLSCTKCPQAGPCIHLVPQAITCGYCVGLSCFAGKQECCDKPAQTRAKQRELTNKIFNKYSIAAVQNAVHRQHPLWLATQDPQKMA